MSKTKIKKAVVLAAGLGTRVLPATKAIPKEMLMIADRPAIQYVVEEIVAAGITDICIVISRGKESLQNHFDRAPELEQALAAKGKTDMLDEVIAISQLANIVYVRQLIPKGTADAVLAAKSFVGDDPFVVLYADDVFIGEKSATKEICEAYEQYGIGALSMQSFTQEQIMKYSSLKLYTIDSKHARITDMNEKPQPHEIFSTYSILGRCALPGQAMGVLKEIKPGVAGELYLTDAMKMLARSEGMIGVVCDSKRYDMGDKLGVMQANVEVALNHPVIGSGFREYLKGLGL
jgi:UTP--glucose-1-phosphate uridylyltransferase